jgi:hypothetical protein
VNIQLSPPVSISSAGQPPTLDRLLAISETRKSGLILCKAFHAEFAGPGAVVSSTVEQPYTAVIAIGAPELVAIATPEARRQAYSRRIQWGRWLSKIAEHPDAIERTERLFAGFEGFFGRQVVMSLPTEVVANLIGVFPETVQSVQERYFNLGKFGKTTPLFPREQLRVTTIALDGLAQGDLAEPVQCATTMQEIHQVYARLKIA